MTFCTISDMESLLQMDIPAELHVSATRAIAEATEAIRNYTKQHIYPIETNGRVTFDVMVPRYNLLLPQLPILEITEVLEDGDALVEHDDFKLTQDGQILRVGGRWALGVGAVVVSYAYGYADVPQTVLDIATRAATRAFQAGLRARETDGVPGVSSVALGDWSLNFASEAGGGVWEGVLGVSGTRLLLLSERDALNRYRIDP